MTEKEFQDQIVELVGILGGMVYHTLRLAPVGAGLPGPDHRDAGSTADLRGVEERQGPVTEYQKSWLEALPDHQVYLWRPDDQNDAGRIIQ